MSKSPIINCYCCHLHSNSHVINSREFKAIGNAVVDRIMDNFSKYKCLVDKRVVADGTPRRPDLQLDLGSHIVVIKVVEDVHVTTDSSNMCCDVLIFLGCYDLL